MGHCWTIEISISDSQLPQGCQLCVDYIRRNFPPHLGVGADVG